MIRDLVIGLDSSTSATKAVAFDRAGVAVAEGRAAIALSNPRQGHFEQAPEDWWGSAVAALLELTARIDPARIAGLAISNQRETFAAFTRAGEALRPGMLWLDDRARPQMARFGAAFGAGRIHEISGKPLQVSPCLYRMIWMREHEPEIYARTEIFADVHGYLAFRLTGRWVTSIASADPMGLVDMRRLDWSDEILAAAAIPRGMLATLARPGEFLGVVDAAARTGLPPGVPVFAGGGDGQCAGTGAGALTPGRAYVNLGTAAVAGLHGEAYAFHPAFRTEVAIAETGYIFETSLRTGAFLVDWLVGEVFGVAPGDRRAALAELEAAAAEVPVGSGGLLVLPYWQGVMNPHWDSDARGWIAGFTGSARKAEIYRAMLEGVAIEVADTMDAASAASGRAFDHYVAIGGGAASDLWVQILADAAGRPVSRSMTAEASALGAAMAAAKGAGWFVTIDQACEAMTGKTARAFEPDPARADAYRELRSLQTELWPLVANWNRRLAALADRWAGSDQNGIKFQPRPPSP